MRFGLERGSTGLEQAPIRIHLCHALRLADLLRRWLHRVRNGNPIGLGETGGRLTSHQHCVGDHVATGQFRQRSNDHFITDHPDKVCEVITREVDRGSSSWPIRGGYTGEEHAVVFCMVHRAQLSTLRRVVAEADPAAFVVLTNGSQALGSGFQPLSPKAGF